VKIKTGKKKKGQRPERPRLTIVGVARPDNQEILKDNHQ